MQYNILLFDLDNTLLDFSKSEKKSLSLLFEYYNCADYDNIREVYQIENHKLWKQYEAGEISFKELLNKRFAKTMQHYDIEIDGAKWDEKYHYYLRKYPFLMDDEVPKVLEVLSKSYRLFVATNGIAKTQIERLRKTKLLDYFEAVFASKEIGHQKPDIRFFEYVQEHIIGFEASKALMIGDSVDTDILGGNKAGIDTCLIGKNEENEVESTYQIEKISDLYDILR